MSITRVSDVFSATTTADTTFEGESVTLPAVSAAGRYKIAMNPANQLVATVNGGPWAAFIIPVPSAAYTVTNNTPDRGFDSNSTSVNEMADVLGTVIADLITAGIFTGSVT